MNLKASLLYLLALVGPFHVQGHLRGEHGSVSGLEEAMEQAVETEAGQQGDRAMTTTGTCGNGNRGNGICPDTTLCCSQYGYCGTGTVYCTSNGGTCGNGNRGNGICSDTTLCCSQYGYCGTGTAYCGSTGNGGTCGNGNRGNGICADGTCCSQYGYCGTGTAYCGSGGGGNGGSCGNGIRGNGICADGTCCSQYGYCGTGTAYCNGGSGGGGTGASTPPTGTTGGVIGYYEWTWSTSQALSNANVGVAFSGWADVTQALQDSSSVVSSLQDTRYLSIGGGDSDGRFTSAVLTNLNSAIAAGKLSAYKGIVYDVEEGDSGLSSAFATSFATAKKYGFKVLVTVSHSAPYGVSDARTLMLSFFSNTNIDYISPQLYTSGTESQNDYTAGYGVAWSDYKQSRAKIVPSIVQASYYSSAQTYFSGQGITLGGYIQWKN